MTPLLFLDQDGGHVVQHYRERIQAPSSNRLLGSGVGTVGVVLLIVAIVRYADGSSREDLAFVVVAAIIALTTGISVAAGSMTLVVDEHVCTIRIRGLVTRRIPLSNIHDATTTVLSSASYGGTGARRAPGRPPAIFLSSGPAVLIDLEQGGAMIVQSTTPELLVAALRTPPVDGRPAASVCDPL